MTDSDESQDDAVGDSEDLRDENLDDLVADLHGHLEATAHLPVEESASRWLGEAEAVCEDAVGADVPESVVEKRVRQAEMLLSNVEGTGNDAADERVRAARKLVETLEARL